MKKPIILVEPYAKYGVVFDASETLKLDSVGYKLARRRLKNRDGGFDHYLRPTNREVQVAQLSIGRYYGTPRVMVRHSVTMIPLAMEKSWKERPPASVEAGGATPAGLLRDYISSHKVEPDESLVAPIQDGVWMKAGPADHRGGGVTYFGGQYAVIGVRTEGFHLVTGPNCCFSNKTELQPFDQIEHPALIE